MPLFNARTRNLLYLSFAFDLVIVGAVALWAMGHPLICKCGYVKFWHGLANSSENSQHIADWYTFSHIIHGFLFYGLYWLMRRLSGRTIPLAAGFLVAVALEVSWEVVENSDAVIKRYREATIALDYFGDSVLNSTSDVLAMALGFGLALDWRNGSHLRIYLAAADTYLEEETAPAVARALPGVPLRRPLVGFSGLIDTGKANETLGFVPRYSWRDYFRGVSPE